MEPGVTIGHVHLRTADIDRIRAFYVDLMGFDVVMEARDVPGLYAIGEAVDVTGWLGGYNFQWAWASGFVIAQNI